MRILFVINSFFYGGAEKLVYDLAQALATKGEQISVAGLYRMENDTEERMRQCLESKGVKTYILDKHAGENRFSSVRKLCKIVRSDNIQLIHAHCTVPMQLSKLTGIVTGAKVVCTVHSTRGYNAWLEKMTGWLVHSYVSIGEAAEEYMLTSLGLNEKKITRIYNAVDTDRFRPAERTSEFWNEWGFDDAAPVILNVGRVVSAKNQICLLRALEKCRNNGKPIQCAILGGFDEESETYKTLQAYIRNNSLDKYVCFLGQRDDVPLFLHNSDCFVMTSWYEGLSVAYLEAVLCGTPMVTTDLPFVRELQQFGNSAVIVPQDDSDALAEVLLYQSYEPIPKETIARFREKFSMVNFAHAHLQLYCQIIGGN